MEDTLQRIFIEDTTNGKRYYLNSVINISPSKEMNLTNFATTEGTSMTDYAYKEPVRLSLSLKFGELNNFKNAYIVNDNMEKYYPTCSEMKKLLNDWFENKIRLIIQTRVETFENMIISSLNDSESSSNLGVYSASLTLKECRVAKIANIKVGPFVSKENKVVNNTETNSGNVEGTNVVTTIASIGLGAAAGAAVGSIVPGIGTVAGALIGGAISFFGTLL